MTIGYRQWRAGRIARHIAVLSAWLTLGACGGSGGPGGASNTGNPAGGNNPAGCVPANPATADQCGRVLLAVTDADGDFVSYAVDVLAVTLHRADSGRVETLPATTRIDFAELTDLAELLSAATLAPGDIVGGTIRLDYGNAEIFVESGGQIVAAEAVDAGGTPLGIVDLEIRLADREHLVVTRGRTALLSIDFDLAASHTVDLTTIPVRVTTEPYLVAEIRPLEEKEIRVRGALVDVDTQQSSYDIRVRPWHRHDGDFGTVTVHTTPATTFEVNGASYTGAAGLAALDALEAGALTVAFGTLDLAERRFTAAIVHAGDSVGGERFAAVYGNIVARSGDRLTVKGALAVHLDRPAHFRRTVLIDVGPDTGVVKTGDPLAALDAGALSVGQRIVAFGQFTNADAAMSGPADAPLILDATHGRVRMLVTHLHGTVNAVQPGQLNLELQAIDRLGIELFDFAGTGSTAANDADPLDYEIATATLPLAGVEVGKWARVFGFVMPFGAAPPDFAGRTVVDHRNIPAALGIGWGIDGTTAPFLVMEPTGLVVDLANPDIGARHHLLLGLRVIDLFDLPSAPVIAPPQDRGLFGLAQRGHVELFTDFGEFVAALTLRVAAGDSVHSLAAYGSFDESANALVASRIGVHLTPAE